ncbi:MAG: DUF805 domain-containing protein [Xanthobacteraceae bacterium]
MARQRPRADIAASIDWRRLFTSLEGRIGRQLFWIGVLLLLFVGIPIQLFVVALAGDLAGFIVSLAFLYPGYAVNVKRAHDRNRPAWIIGLFYALLIAIVFMQLADLHMTDGQPNGPFVLAGATFLLFAIVLTIDLGILRGTPGKNQYGPDPLKQR